MRLFQALCLIVAAILALPNVAHAQSNTMPTAAELPFAATALSEAELSNVRGGQAVGVLTSGSALRLIDDQARADLRFTGDLGRIVMDVWWGSTGGELVAQSVRASLRP